MFDADDLSEILSQLCGSNWYSKEPVIHPEIPVNRIIMKLKCISDESSWNASCLNDMEIYVFPDETGQFKITQCLNANSEYELGARCESFDCEYVLDKSETFYLIINVNFNTFLYY